MNRALPRDAAWYSRWGWIFWLASSLAIIASVWFMDVPAGTPVLVEGRVEAVEADGRITVAIPSGRVTVASRVPYRRGDAVKLKRHSTAIFKRTTYTLD